MENVLRQIDQAVKKEFESNQRILSFDEYLSVLGQNPERQLRHSSAYLVDLMDHAGKTEIEYPDSAISGEPPTYRFHLFDQPVDGYTHRLVGHERVQTQIYRALNAFVRQGLNNRLILLHGPNGSAKTTLVHALMSGMERYSHLPEGAVYTFNWIFPVERITRGGLGLGSGASTASDTRRGLTSYARLPEEEIAARLPSEFREHPFLLIPFEHRRNVLESLLGKEKGHRAYQSLPDSLKRGDLCHRSRQIFDALLISYKGNYEKVLMHVQVERFYFSRRYRAGLVSIEPQLHVDAQSAQITQNRSIASLPASLQGLNLYQTSGELIDGNRGIVEFSDLLKRPVDTFKYLLGLCETGSFNVGASIAQVDTVLLATTNELQLDAFKEFPDFPSFKARFELIRVPYLLSVHQERQIYAPMLPQVAGEKTIAPHVDWAVALWSVLTRLKKPNSINYPPEVSNLVSKLTPLEKARLYDTGEMPMYLTREDRQVLRTNLRRLREEYNNIPYYEGRMGASAREMKGVLIEAAQNPEFPTLSPLSILRTLEDFVKRLSEYDFLKQDVKEGYHDATEFIQTVRNEYIEIIDREVRESVGLYDSKQWEDFIRKYVHHIATLLKHEKIQNPVTGKMEDPDRALIEEFERIVDAPKATSEIQGFRQTVISQVGAWSLDHPKEKVQYARVFPDFWKKLERHYFESQKAALTRMYSALLDINRASSGVKDVDLSSESHTLARRTLENMKSRLGYSDESAQEVIAFLMKKRYF